MARHPDCWRGRMKPRVTASFLERRLRAALSVLLAGVGLACASVTAAARADFARIEPAERRADGPLRVCSDPDNLPLSHADGSGFENRIAAVLAQAVGRPLKPYWLPQRRGFGHESVGEAHCDVFIGVPAGSARLSTTRPYYRSSYVFVTRAGDPHPLRDLADPRLPRLRIGVQLPGDDGAETPPGHALARHGAVDQVVRYPPYGSGLAALHAVQAVQRGDLDAAVLWGPQAGWFAVHASPALDVRIAPRPADVELPFELPIAVGVRKGDLALRDALQAALDSRRTEIDAILQRYAVPRSDAGEGRRQ
jgi:mxaJ protein